MIHCVICLYYTPSYLCLFFIICVLFSFSFCLYSSVCWLTVIITIKLVSILRPGRATTAADTVLIMVTTKIKLHSTNNNSSIKLWYILDLGSALHFCVCILQLSTTAAV